MKEKIKNGLVFAAGMVAGAVTLMGAIATFAVFMPGGYTDRFGTDVLKTEWPKKEDDTENE